MIVLRQRSVCSEARYSENSTIFNLATNGSPFAAFASRLREKKGCLAMSKPRVVVVGRESGHGKIAIGPDAWHDSSRGYSREDIKCRF